MECRSVASGWVKDTLLHLSHEIPNATALRYHNKNEAESLTYSQLLTSAYTVARAWAPALSHHQRAILIMPGDMRFVISLTACVLSGVAAIPVHLTNAIRIHRNADKIEQIIDESQPEYILTLGSLVDEIKEKGWHVGRQLLIVDELLSTTSDDGMSEEDRVQCRALYHGGGPVYLQYSSGSTGRPKAVCNYDANIEAQINILQRNHRHCLPRIITANWLPFYHDMGMFCGLLLPLLTGGCCNFMSPVHVVKEPFDWLKLIERYQANAVAAPDFIWALCESMVSDEQCAQLDLSSLRVAANSAEPLRADTMQRFAERFAQAGFDPISFTPAYGMAESTLMISSKPIGSAYVMRHFDSDGLAAGQAVLDPQGIALISSGQVADGWQVQIVDPDTRQALPEGRVGEVWASGPSKAYGYDRNHALTAEVFDATLADRPQGERYLRTGDLGFLWEGELFIHGRLKDVIIVAGENHMPNTLEADVEAYCEQARTGGVCACQNTATGELIMMVEARRHQDDATYQAFARGICARISDTFGLAVAHVVVLPSSRLRKTSSGKIRRRQMLAEYLSEALSPLYVYRADVSASASRSTLQTVHDEICNVLSVDAFDPEVGFAEAGLSSMQALRFCQRLNEQYARRLVVADLFAHPSLKQLAAHLDKTNAPRAMHAPRDAATADDEIAIVAISSRLPGQRSARWEQAAEWLAEGKSALAPVVSQHRQLQLPVGALEDIAGFDAAFFGVGEAEAQLIDPQQRLLLEESWHLFEAAGWLPETLKTERIGFYIGQGHSEFNSLLWQSQAPECTKGFMATGSNASASSGRLAKFYGTRGPAITLDTGCSSSLVALDLALRSLHQGQCSAAVVGGVNVLLSPKIEQTLRNANMLSPQGRCATFSDEADGYARGEGTVMLLVKPHAQAVRDGDPVLAVIEHSVAAQDGESSSLTAPNPQAQAAMMQQLLDEARCTPDQISLIETQGTGTLLGDPIELSAIDTVYGQRQTPLRLGAGKTQVGHLEAASGLFSVLRAVAQLHRQQAFGHPTFQRLNPQLTDIWPRYHYDVATVPCALERVAINAFSFSGTMAGVLIRKAPTAATPETPAIPPLASGILPVSAPTEVALQALAQSLAESLQQHPDQAGAMVAAWCATRTHHFAVRALVEYWSLDDLVDGLLAVSGQRVDRLKTTTEGHTPSDWLNGHHVDWRTHVEGFTASALTLLPLYPFEHTQHWPASLLAQAPDTERCPVQIEADDTFVRQWVSRNLNVPLETLTGDEDLMLLGLNSLQMLDLVDDAKARGVTLTLAGLFDKTTLSAWEHQWQTARRPSAETPVAASVPVWQGEAFTLTPVQYAYWRGRHPDQIMGGIACQVYLELNCAPLDDTAVAHALDQLQRRHDLLRLRINEHDQGYLVPPAPMQPVSHGDATLSPEACDHLRAQLQQQLSHRVLDLTQECGVSVTLSHGPHDTRMHLNIDMVIADGMSVHILLAELSHALQHPEAPLPTLTYSFPQYLLEQQALDRSASQAYWQRRLDEGLPRAPQLPLMQAPEQVGTPRFSHRDWQLEAAQWTRMKETARRYGITPSMLLAGCYAQTLRQWAAEPAFSLNLTIFNRRGEHPELPQLVADFTTLLLLSCDVRADEPLVTMFERLNRRFMQDLDHADYGATDVMRDAARKYGQPLDMPIVFTSNLGRDLLSSDYAGTLHYWISQTPQVWLDCQVMEDQGALWVCWDSVDALFPDGMVDDMFDAYCRLITQLSEVDDWTLPCPVMLPAAQRDARHVVNTATLPVAATAMHERVAEVMARCPDQLALIDDTTRLTYRQLAERVEALAQVLLEMGVRQGERVGVSLPRGAEQVIAVLAVQWVGAAYVPFSLEWPLHRRVQIVQQVTLRHVIAAPSQTWPDDVNLIDVEAQPLSGRRPQPARVSGDALAYVIFTSGSTGTPKGVAISHAAAVNTLETVNRRYHVTAESRALALSALNFDLSVWDIFGLLSAGGTLVIVPEAHNKDARHWLTQLQTHRITVWNSVPALLALALSVCEDDKAMSTALQGLTLIMLSGDWISPELVSRIQRLAPKARIRALGGATEASIWSNHWTVEDTGAEWNAVPYGVPLPNQMFSVVNEDNRPCPDWVPGELLIGGAGVALGYFGDTALTEAHFFRDEQGIRWYRTGDVGRYRPGAVLEFLGRRDHQVKVSGHRLELDEIRQAITDTPSVRDATVWVMNRNERAMLAAVVEAETAPDWQAMAQALQMRLPLYAIPTVWGHCTAWPLTANGKRDQHAIEQMIGHLPERATDRPLTEMEQSLLRMMQSLLNTSDIDIHDNFFGLGGDSLIATRLTTALRQEYDLDISLRQIFHLQTLDRIADAMTGALQSRTDTTTFEEGSL